MSPRPCLLTTRLTLSLLDRLRVLVGVPLFARCECHHGDCHAACRSELVVQRGWPENPKQFAELRTWWPRR